MAETLLQRVAQKDPAAVKAVLDQYGGLVWSLVRRFSNETDAEDAVQEVFMDVWKSAPRFDPGVASEATFIAMIARRRLIDRSRRASRRAPESTIIESAVPARTDYGERVEHLDEAAWAAQAFGLLSVEQQRVLRLSIYQGLSHEEIAQSTGLPLGTVKTHCRRGLIRIREVLEQNRKKNQPEFSA